MIRFLVPIFPRSQKAFAAQIVASDVGLVFRENQIGPAYSLTGEGPQQLQAIHDRTMAITRWGFWGFILLVLVAVPLIRMLNSPGMMFGVIGAIAIVIGLGWQKYRLFSNHSPEIAP